MSRRTEFLTDEQREKIEPWPLKEEMPRIRDRPRGHDRRVIEGILWVFRTGERWKDLRNRHPSAANCWRRPKRRETDILWLNMWPTGNRKGNRTVLSGIDNEGDTKPSGPLPGWALFGLFSASFGEI